MIQGRVFAGLMYVMLVLEPTMAAPIELNLGRISSLSEEPQAISRADSIKCSCDTRNTVLGVGGYCLRWSQADVAWCYVKGDLSCPSVC